ncbi:MAG: amino acid ABC transporter permease [Rubrimonas sp.]|uniref:amino acid ABC transporter permease n=1 Tax=Rubrimonas sp. TaxID=2036015 RepID=UPI002FDEACCB
MTERGETLSIGAAAPDLPPPAQARLRARLRKAGDVALFALGAGLLAWAIYAGAQAMGYNWQWSRVPRGFYRVVEGELIWGPLARGLVVTLQITLAAIPLALAIGLATALLRLSRSFAGHALATFYLEIVRNTPLLVQMYLFYFVLAPILGIDRFWTGVLCLAVFEASFISEIIRGGVLAVPRGQWEGAAALGLRPAQLWRKVVLPQAAPLMAPPMTSAVVNLIKNSAIVSTIAVFDLANEARNMIADTFLSFEIWLVVAAVYLCLTIPLSAVAGWLERRSNRNRRAAAPG